MPDLVRDEKYSAKKSEVPQEPRVRDLLKLNAEETRQLIKDIAHLPPGRLGPSFPPSRDAIDIEEELLPAPDGKLPVIRTFRTYRNDPYPVGWTLGLVTEISGCGVTEGSHTPDLELGRIRAIMNWNKKVRIFNARH